MGLGRFALGAAAASIVKPPVLYSFPSEIRIANAEETKWVYESWDAMTYMINFKLALAK